jgi:hypothetical protein
MMVRTAIRDIEAIRAGLPLDARRHSEIVLRHLNQALRDMVPAEGAVVLPFDQAARRASRASSAPRS